MVDSERKEPDENSEPIIGGEEPATPTARNDFVIGATEDTQSGQAFEGNFQVKPSLEQIPPSTRYRSSSDNTDRRQPIFYLSVILALLFVGLLSFLLIRFLDMGDDDASPLVVVQTDFQIKTPEEGKKVSLNEDIPIRVVVSSNYPMESFELYADGRRVDQMLARLPTGKYNYDVLLYARIPFAGEHELFVRAVTTSGNVTDSEPFIVVVAEEELGTQAALKAEVVTAVTVRLGPGLEYESVGVLEPGEVVNVIGKDLNVEWLQIERDGGLWAQRFAFQVSGLLSLLPVVDRGSDGSDTPTPTPTPTPTEEPGLPDFFASNAEITANRTTLTVTISNVSTTQFGGPLIVSIYNPVIDAQQRAFSVWLDPNGTTKVSFSLDAILPDQQLVEVTIDPLNDVEEANEDNNTTNFLVFAPVDGPELTLIPTIASDGRTMSVTVRNDGGPVATNTAELEVSVGAERLIKTLSLALNTNQSKVLTALAIPQDDDESIEIVLKIEGTVLAHVTLVNPNASVQSDNTEN